LQSELENKSNFISKNNKPCPRNLCQERTASGLEYFASETFSELEFLFDDFFLFQKEGITMTNFETVLFFSFFKTCLYIIYSTQARQINAIHAS
jgi:hypothetical protein